MRVMEELQSSSYGVKEELQNSCNETFEEV